ncbi:MAG: TetR/AcrR family transcriptional regulator [Oscillospiraceae bacterium]|nr:TetR/AcrR family transcriptional regulator [Oscillospiraceae bacterium]
MEETNQRRKQAIQTERSILESALTLMRERDFDEVSVRDICKEAGITTGAFYHHFRSKDDLLRLGFAPMDRHLELELAGHLSDPPLVRLERIVDSYAGFMEGQIGRLAARYYQYRLSTCSQEVLDSSRYAYRAILSCLEETKASGMLSAEHTPEEVTDFCMRHFRGIVIDWILHDYDYPLQPRFRRDYGLIRQLFQTRSFS